LETAPWPDAGRIAIPAERTQRVAAVPLEIYDRRVPIYRKTKKFIQTVLKDLQPDLKDILQFASDTDEALFLFDGAISEYLAEIFKQALRLRSVSLTLNRVPADERTASVSDQETTTYLINQFQAICLSSA
jgi:hypothetical protein